jgi:hypothetical protein
MSQCVEIRLAAHPPTSYAISKGKVTRYVCDGVIVRFRSRGTGKRVLVLLTLRDDGYYHWGVLFFSLMPCLAPLVGGKDGIHSTASCGLRVVVSVE